jgi:hypothetical protein
MIRTYLIGAAVGIAGSLAATIVAAIAPLDIDPKTSGAAAFVFWHTWHSSRMNTRLVNTFRAESRRRYRHHQADRQALLAAIERLAPKPEGE